MLRKRRRGDSRGPNSGLGRPELPEAPGAGADNFPPEGAATYDRTVVKRTSARKGPGLAKARAARIVERRAVELFRASDYRWRELFEAADVMSEGAVRSELEGPTYYGTTSLLLPFVSKGGHVPDELALAVARLVARDPHARLRAVRIACREARVRSVHPVGRVRAELVVTPDSRGIRIDVDVEAHLVIGSARSTRARAR